MSKTKSCLVSIFVFLAFLTHSSFVHSDSRSLRGLTAINVMVEDLKPNIEGMGLTREQIKTDIELKLRMAEIKVVSDSEILKIPGMPYLYLQLNTFRPPQLRRIGICVFNICISQMQRVYLERDPAINVSADTWSKNSTGFVGEESIGSIRDRIRDLVDVFINDYLSVNPKGGK